MRLFAGWGFRSGVRQQSFSSCWEQAREQLVPADMAQGLWTFAVLASKSQTSAWREFKTAMPEAAFLCCQESDIRHVATWSVSVRLLQRFGTGSVSEALALHAAGEHAAGTAHPALILPRIVSADRQATLAVAGLALASQPFETGVPL